MVGWGGRGGLTGGGVGWAGMVGWGGGGGGLEEWGGGEGACACSCNSCVPQNNPCTPFTLFHWYTTCDCVE